METRKFVWIALLGLAFLGFQMTASPALADPPGQEPDPVVVTNTVPIPVSGSVNVGNLPATQTVTGTVNVENLGTYRYVGISNDNTTGDAGGRAGMNGLCQEEFGETARMCTTKEFLSTNFSNKIGTPFPPPEDAWIEPSIVSALPSGTNPGWMDYSGFIISPSAPTSNCYQWTYDGSSAAGLVFYNDHIDILGCPTELKVVCCDVQ